VSWLIALGVLLLALLGEPFFVLIAAIAMWGLHSAGYDLTVAASEFYRLTEMPVLVAIPAVHDRGISARRERRAQAPGAPDRRDCWAGCRAGSRSSR
jgi:hypothetical protein